MKVHHFSNPSIFRLPADHQVEEGSTSRPGQWYIHPITVTALAGNLSSISQDFSEETVFTTRTLIAIIISTVRSGKPFSSEFLLVLAVFIDPLLLPDLPFYVAVVSRMIDDLVAKGNMTARLWEKEFDLLHGMTQQIIKHESWNIRWELVCRLCACLCI